MKRKRVSASGGTNTTPRKNTKAPNTENDTPRRETRSQTSALPIRDANQSARRKSARHFVEKVTAPVLSEDEVSEEEFHISEEDEDSLEEGDGSGTGSEVESGEEEESETVHRASHTQQENIDMNANNEDEDEDEEEDEDDKNSEASAPESALPAPATTPSKTSRQVPRTPRGKRGGPKRGKSPSPTTLAHLLPHERYFFDTRPGASKKTSANTLSAGLLLSHDDYFAARDAHRDTHAAHTAALRARHEACYAQWALELREGFNLVLYGYGSKRGVVRGLAQYLCDEAGSEKKCPRIVVANAYSPGLTLANVLSLVAGLLMPSTAKVPLMANALMATIFPLLDQRPENAAKVCLFVNSLDAPGSPFRKAAGLAALKRLAAHPAVWTVVTVDTPLAGMLFDAGATATMRLLWHDTTTFEPWDKVEMDPVEQVNELLGRSGRRLGGKDGVAYVLKSLPENARHLFRILVAEQVVAESERVVEEDVGREDGVPPSTGEGIEYRVLYHKAREELVVSSEHQLGTLLKEFYDHQMVESRRDGTGTERLLVPFRKEELERLLEDLV